MPKLNSSTTTFVVSVLLAGGIIGAVEQIQPGQGFTTPAVAQTEAEAKADESSSATRWAATAPGKVEPVGGEVAIRPEVAGKVAAVHVKAGEKVSAGDVLVQLKDDDLQAKRRAALTEVRIRMGERKEDKPSKAAKKRRDGEDKVYDAQRALYDAKSKLDAARLARREGSGKPEDVKTAQEAVTKAEADLTAAEKELEEINALKETPLPTRLEGGLQTARAELRVIEIALERMKIRAPSDGTVLAIDARLGELASPAGREPLIRFGNLDKLTIRAEVAERDLGKVKLGQGVVIETSAFPGQQFEGSVARIAPSFTPPKIGHRGPRAQSDVDVVEVTIDVAPGSPLMSGMRVDVYFKPIKTAANTKVQ